MFLLKKVLSQFLSPLPLCLALVILGLLIATRARRQRLGKGMIVVGVVVLALFSHWLVADTLLANLEGRYPTYAIAAAGGQSVEYVIVLSAGHCPDPDLPSTSQLTDASLMRVVEGIRIYRLSPGSKLLLSGGSAFYPIPEAETMACVAIELGVPSEDIMLEEESRDTEDQARLVSQLVGGSHCVLVTSASHMPRSMGLFAKQGLYPIPAPTQHRATHGALVQADLLFPSADNLGKTEMAVHEYLGIVWARLRGLI